VQRLKGLPITQGAAIGQAVLLVHRGRAVRFPVPPERVEPEVQRLVASRDRSRAQLEAIKARIANGPASDLAPLFDAQLLMLDDPMIFGRAVALVRAEHVNAEWAVQRAFEEVAGVFESLEDPYFRERKGDVEDVVGRLRMNLRHGVVPRDLLRDVEGPFILVADELSASMAAQIDWTRVRGFAMDAGTRTYHTAILARSLQIPAVVGLHDATARVTAGAEVALDGLAGELIIDPTPDVVHELARRPQPGAAGLSIDLSLPPVTRDGVRIRIDANVDRSEDVGLALRQGAEGVGLFRSEVMLGSDGIQEASEELQFEVYRRVLEGMYPHRVTVRTFDVDEDRQAARGDADRWGGDADRRRRPLGLRGIRLSLAHPDLFRRQVRAMLRAAVHGQLRMLLPFVSAVEEVRQARHLIAQATAELAAGGILVPPVPVGAMIEVPSAALTADLLAREVDFLAIGTNDLIQYVLAVDRTDERVSHLYQPLHPGLLRLLRVVRRAAAGRRTPLSVCGEMASDPALLALLIGLGMTEFSMTPGAIPAARQLVSAVRADDLRGVARRALHLGTIAEIESYLDATVKELGARVLVPPEGS
jgi:phosphoenolpyruvate-protein phosphotransferase (PTS system enzyme I)